jgi:hypothetical protein
MPIPIWAESILLFIAAFVVSPAIAATIGFAAWKGKPKIWDRSMYWTAFASSMIALLALAFFISRMEAGFLELGLFLLAVLLFLGVGGGCFIGILIYARGKGPIWRSTESQPQRSSNDGQS